MIRNIVVAQLGARLHYAVPRILFEKGILDRLFTDFYVGNKPVLEKLFGISNYILRQRVIEKILGRKNCFIPRNKVVAFNLLGIKSYINHHKADFWKLPDVEVDISTRFNQKIIRHGIHDCDAIYGHRCSSLELFRHAKYFGKKCILEQNIAPARVERSLMREEVSQWPGWQPQLEKLLQRKDPIDSRESEEWRLADTILAPSDFVKKSLEQCGVSSKKIRIVPYGVDLNYYTPVKKSPQHGRPLHMLFVGEVGLRKGIPYLLEALRMLNTKDVEVKIAGNVVISYEKFKAYSGYVEFLGSVPRSRVKVLYDWADVLVLPSICEGSATVIYEALACGIPVITTLNAGFSIDKGCHIMQSVDSVTLMKVLEDTIHRHGKNDELQLPAMIPRKILGIETYAEALINALS